MSAPVTVRVATALLRRDRLYEQLRADGVGVQLAARVARHHHRLRREQLTAGTPR